MFGLGFFASIKLVQYSIVLAAIVLIVWGLFSIFGWISAMGLMNRASKNLDHSSASFKRNGDPRWTVDR